MTCEERLLALLNAAQRFLDEFHIQFAGTAQEGLLQAIGGLSVEVAMARRFLGDNAP